MPTFDDLWPCAGRELLEAIYDRSAKHGSPDVERERRPDGSLTWCTCLSLCQHPNANGKCKRGKDVEPSAEALALAGEMTLPEMGGDAPRVKNSAYQSDRETVELARRLDAFAARRLVEAVAIERERCAKIALNKITDVMNDLIDSAMYRKKVPF